MTSGARLPTWKERENNKKRERRRRAIASKIFSGLRQFGNYKLPKHCDNNEVLKALCAEAGWVVEEDGTTYRKGAKPVERMEVCASAPASPSPTSSYHNGHTITTTATTPATDQNTGTASGASLIPWLKGLSGTTTPTSCFHGSSSAPVTPPLSSPSKPFVATAATIAPKSHQHSEWDRITMAEHWLDSSTAAAAAFGNGGSWSPVIVGPAIASPSAARAAATRPCETPDGCLTPCSDVGDSEPNVSELLSRYSGNKSGRWINGMRVVAANPSLSGGGGGGGGAAGIFGSVVPMPISSSGTATPTAGRSFGTAHHHFVENGGGGWMKPAVVPAAAQLSFPTAPQMANHHHPMVFNNGGGVYRGSTSGTAAAAAVAMHNNDEGDDDHHHHQQQQQQQQCSPCSSSVCGVVLETGKRKRSLHEMDLEMTSSITRLQAMATNDANGGGRINSGGNANNNVADRLQLTLATPASSS